MVSKKQSSFYKFLRFAEYVQGTISFICVLVLLGYGLYRLIMYIRSKTEHFIEFFKCTITLNDIDPKLVDEYMKYNDKRIPDGKCKFGRSEIIINTCPVDANGIVLQSCKKSGSIKSSIDNPSLTLPTDISPDSIKQFFHL